MLGIIIDAQIEDEVYPNKILHKFQDRSSLERVVAASLGSEYAVSVIVAMSQKARPYAVGTTYQDPVIDKRITGLERSATYFFHNKKPLERLYFAARDHKLDTIVRISGDSPFIPTWLINEVIYEYYKCPNVFLHSGPLPNLSKDENENMYPDGLNIEVMPFFMLTRALIYIKNNEDFYKYIYNNFKTSKFMNIKDSSNYIHDPNFSLRFNSRSQIKQFDSLLYETKYSDIGDLLKELANGKE